MDFAKIGLIAGSILIVYILYKLYKKYIDTKIIIREEPEDAKVELSVPNEDMLLSQEFKGLSFSTSFWIFVKDWNYKYMTDKTIFNKGGFKLLLGNKMNDLYIEMPILGSYYPEKILFKDIPLQKWLHIVITLENRSLDLWINGKLYASRHLKNLPKIMEKQPMIFAQNGGFSGYISRIYHFEDPLSKQGIITLFKKGPINNNPIMKLWRKLRGVAGSVKLNVNVDVDANVE
tara:strand:+ start:6242 stop:6937 length:696 start_codon:yes stop_codon:yes gene_type:complete